MAPPGQPEILVRQAPRAILAPPVLPVISAPPARLETLALPARLATLVLPVLRAILALPARLEILGLPVLLATLVLPAQLDQREQRVPPARQVQIALLQGRLVQPETPVLLVPLARLVPLVPPARLEQLARLVLPGLRGQPGLREPPARLEQLEQLAQQAQLVRPEPPVLRRIRALVLLTRPDRLGVRPTPQAVRVQLSR